MPKQTVGAAPRGRCMPPTKAGHLGRLPRLLASLLAVGCAASAAGVLNAGSAGAATAPVDLGTAAAFAVLGASTVTNTGPTTLIGDLGVSPGTAITGFPPGTVVGVVHAADAVAANGQAAAATAYADAAGRTADVTVTGDLGGQTLAAGVYAGPTLSLTGTLTLDGAGDPTAVFILRSGSTLLTAAGSVVALIGNASPCNVFWQIGSSATLGTGAVMRGTVVASASITATTGGTVDGRLIARGGAVTLDTTAVTKPTCAALVPAPTATSAPATTAPATTAPATTAPATSAPATSASGTPGPSATGAPVGSASPDAATPSPTQPTPSTTPLAPVPVSSVLTPAAPTATAGAAGAGGSRIVGPVVAATPRTSEQPRIPLQPARPGLPATGSSADLTAAFGVPAIAIGWLFLLLGGARPRRQAST